MTMTGTTGDKLNMNNMKISPELLLP